MNSFHDGGYAFPVPMIFDGTSADSVNERGMSLRDYFAAKALVGMLACPDIALGGPKEYAARAYQHADAMLEEADKDEPGATTEEIAEKRGALRDALEDAQLALEAIKANWGDEYPGLAITVEDELARTRAALAKDGSR